MTPVDRGRQKAPQNALGPRKHEFAPGLVWNGGTTAANTTTFTERRSIRRQRIHSSSTERARCPPRGEKFSGKRGNPWGLRTSPKRQTRPARISTKSPLWPENKFVTGESNDYRFRAPVSCLMRSCARPSVIPRRSRLHPRTGCLLRGGYVTLAGNGHGQRDLFHRREQDCREAVVWTTSRNRKARKADCCSNFPRSRCRTHT